MREGEKAKSKKEEGVCINVKEGDNSNNKKT